MLGKEKGLVSEYRGSIWDPPTTKEPFRLGESRGEVLWLPTVCAGGSVSSNWGELPCPFATPHVISVRTGFSATCPTAEWEAPVMLTGGSLQLCL